MEYAGVYHSSRYGRFINRDKITENTRVEIVETKIETQVIRFPFIINLLK